MKRICSHCNREMFGPSTPSDDSGTTHGICPVCFVVFFSGEPIEGLSAKVEAEDLDRLPFGLIVLDAEMRVTHYNQTEAKLVGRDPADVLGQRFFAEIAPCMNAEQVGIWAEQHAQGTAIAARDVDWLLRLPQGDVLVNLSMAAGKGRVVLELEPTEAIRTTSQPSD